MARIKTTKNELKAQRDTMRRLERYLPTLQLKKTQLQVEVRQVDVRIEQNQQREQALLDGLRSWVSLFSDPVDFAPWLDIVGVSTDTANIAGVTVPVLREVEFQRTQPPLDATPPWYDDALQCLADLAKLRLERRVFDEQRRLLAEELRTTNQRVNLFERVKIPECKEAIRKIRIFLGDVQTLDVARSKIAKQKTLERETAT
jgi:V/A-type H+-transporting ATPase subunit D